MPNNGTCYTGCQTYKSCKKERRISSVCKVMSSDLEAVAEAESRKEWNATSEAIRKDVMSNSSDSEGIQDDNIDGDEYQEQDMTEVEE